MGRTWEIFATLGNEMCSITLQSGAQIVPTVNESIFSYITIYCRCRSDVNFVLQINYAFIESIDSHQKGSIQITLKFNRRSMRLPGCWSACP